jgi:hypothetical protein
MGTDAKNTVGLKLIQLASDTYVIQHQCLLSPMKTVKIGEEMLIIYPDTFDPLIYPARLLELWQHGDVLYLKLWNYNQNKESIYTQDLTTEESLFSFVSVPFISKLAKVITDQNIHELRTVNKHNRNSHGHSLIANVTLKGKPNLPQPHYNNSGKKVLEFISSSEIILDLPFILTRHKRLKLNMPYLKTENNLSGNKVSAIRILNFDTYDTIIVLYVQELQSKKTYSIEYNMDSTSGYWIWSLSDFENLVEISKVNC